MSENEQNEAAPQTGVDDSMGQPQTATTEGENVAKQTDDGNEK